MARDLCPVCEKWVATSWQQHMKRLDEDIAPCPHCGHTYWATKAPVPAAVLPGGIVSKIVAAGAAAVVLAALLNMLR